MPRMDAAIYAAHMDNVLKLAQREGGVSRPQLISELNVTRSVASALIDKCGLALDHKDGRTEYFTPTPVAAGPQVKQSTPPAVKAVATPESDDTGEVDPLEGIAALDAQILETRASLRGAAVKSGKALMEWGTQQAIVDAMRVRLSELVVERFRASP